MWRTLGNSYSSKSVYKFALSIPELVRNTMLTLGGKSMKKISNGKLLEFFVILTRPLPAIIIYPVLKRSIPIFILDPAYTSSINMHSDEFIKFTFYTVVPF